MEENLSNKAITEGALSAYIKGAKPLKSFKNSPRRGFECVPRIFFLL